MDIEKLLKTNKSLLNLTTAKIIKNNLNILNQLMLSKQETTKILNKLNKYKYINEFNDIKYGSYIRWIPIEDPSNIYLTNGAIFCELKYISDEEFVCVCKNLFNNYYFQISLEKNLIFQKLTHEEKILLKAIDIVSK